MSEGLRARGQLPRVRAQHASFASKTSRKTKGRNCAQLFAIANVSAHSGAQLCTIAHVCTDCARCAVAACAFALACGAPRYCIHMDMDGCWTSQPASLERYHEPKTRLQTVGQPSLQQTHMQQSRSWQKGAIGHNCSHLCASARSCA